MKIITPTTNVIAIVRTLKTKKERRRPQPPKQTARILPIFIAPFHRA